MFAGEEKVSKKNKHNGNLYEMTVRAMDFHSFDQGELFTKEAYGFDAFL